MARPKRPPKSPPAAPPTPTASPPAPPDDGPSYPQTHTFAYRPGSEAMSCACGAEQDLRLVDGKATRFYRMAGGSWGRSIATCPKYVPPAPPAPPPPPSPHAESTIRALTEALREQNPDLFAPEIIDGCDVEKTAAEMVDLEIACSPVLPHRAPTDPLAGPGDTLIPVEMTPLGGSRYRIYCDEGPRDVSIETAKVMRARYLLRRGELARALPTMDERTRERWMRLYHIAWMPPAGSPLGRQVQTGEVITIKREDGKPIDFPALMRTLSTPGAAIPDVCPTLPDEPPPPAP